MDRFCMWTVAVNGRDVGIIANPAGLSRREATREARLEHSSKVSVSPILKARLAKVA